MCSTRAATHTGANGGAFPAPGNAADDRSDAGRNPDIASIELKGCRENNLKDVNVRIPLGGLICVTGVSGSGKSTLINQTLLPALKRKLYGSKVKAGVHKTLNGAKPADLPVEQPTKFELVLNLETAQTLGITMPPSLLLLADEVIKQACAWYLRGG